MVEFNAEATFEEYLDFRAETVELIHTFDDPIVDSSFAATVEGCVYSFPKNKNRQEAFWKFCLVNFKSQAEKMYEKSKETESHEDLEYKVPPGVDNWKGDIFED